MRTAMSSSHVLLAVILSAFASSVLADPFGQDDVDWLKTMAFAAHQTDYVGTFVYQYGNHVETSRITHVSDSNGEHGRLESLDGTRREIIHSKNQVWCYLGGRKVSVENRQRHRSFPALLPQQLSLLNKNYRIRKAEEVRVAGFHTYAFVFQPKDNLRYVHKMWAHNDSGLLLKAAVLDGQGRVIEQYAFTQLSIGGDIDRSWIVPDKATGNMHIRHGYYSSSETINDAYTADADVETENLSGWQVDALPPGFLKTVEIRRTLRNKKSPVTHLVFSDGLAGISVFIEDMDDQVQTNSGLSSQGAIQIYGKVTGSHLVTVVGEVPPRTIIQVADSVRYGGQ